MTIVLRTFLEWLEGPGRVINLLHPDRPAARKQQDWLMARLAELNRSPWAYQGTRLEITWQRPGARKEVNRMTAKFLLPEQLRGLRCDRLWVDRRILGQPAYRLALLGLDPRGDHHEAIRIGGPC